MICRITKTKTGEVFVECEKEVESKRRKTEEKKKGADEETI